MTIARLLRLSVGILLLYDIAISIFFINSRNAVHLQTFSQNQLRVRLTNQLAVEVDRRSLLEKKQMELRKYAATEASAMQQKRPGSMGDQMTGFVSSNPELMKDPSYRNNFSIRIAGMIESKYAALFHQLRLTPEVLAQFKHELIESALSSIDAAEAMRESGGTSKTPEATLGYLRLRATMDAEADVRYKSILGDELLATFKEFDSTFPLRTALSSFDNHLSFSSEPLQLAQLNGLIQIMAAANIDGNKVATENFVFPIEVIERARYVLTVGQWAEFKRLNDDRATYIR